MGMIIYSYVFRYFICISPIGGIALLVIYRSITGEKFTKYKFAICYFLMIFLSFLASNYICYIFIHTATIENGKRDSDLHFVIKSILDQNSGETITVSAKPDEVKTYYKIEKRVKTRLIYKVNKYYIEIRDGEYVFPLGDLSGQFIAENLLYKNYGEQKDKYNTFELYKNTKRIKSINGVYIHGDIARDSVSFIRDREYKASINLTDDNNINLLLDGCSIEDYVKNEDVTFGVFDETDKIVFTTEQILGKNEKTIEGAFFGNLSLSKIADHIYTDGKYKVILLRKYKDEFMFISNSIDFEVKNKNVVKIN